MEITLLSPISTSLWSGRNAKKEISQIGFSLVFTIHFMSVKPHNFNQRT